MTDFDKILDEEIARVPARKSQAELEAEGWLFTQPVPVPPKPAVDESEWISLEEQKPTYGQYVIARKRNPEDIDRLAQYYTDLGFCRRPGGFFISGITHWKPYTE